MRKETRKATLGIIAASVGVLIGGRAITERGETAAWGMVGLASALFLLFIFGWCAAKQR